MTLEPARPTGEYLPTLDGWRAVAILMVILHHDKLHRLGPLSTEPLYHYGAFGVDLFFAISGLLICSRLLDEERRLGTFSVRAFYVRRAFRILPPAVLFLAVIGILHLAGIIPLHLRDWMAALLFWRNYLPAQCGGPDTMWYTGHFWSLAVEEHFYLLLPAILLFARRRVTVLFSIATLIVCWRGYVSLYGTIDRFRTDQRLDALLIPAILAILISTRGRNFLKPYLRILVVIPCCVLIGILASRSLFAATIFEPYAFAMVVASTMLHPGTWIGKLLESPPLRFVGRISYSLYLWQQLFFVGHYEPGNKPLGWVQNFPLNWLCLFSVALLSYYLFEKPLMRLGHRLAARFGVRMETSRPLSVSRAE